MNHFCIFSGVLATANNHTKIGADFLDLLGLPGLQYNEKQEEVKTHLCMRRLYSCYCCCCFCFFLSLYQTTNWKLCKCGNVLNAPRRSLLAKLPDHRTCQSLSLGL